MRKKWSKIIKGIFKKRVKMINYVQSVVCIHGGGG